MTQNRRNSKKRDIHELVVSDLVALDGGPLTGRWYHAADWVALRKACDRYPAEHPAGYPNGYHPTTEDAVHPDHEWAKQGVTATTWRWKEPER